MPDSCTCGAKLPEDALFCHKCGKPQRDYLASVEEDAAPPPVLPPPPPPPPVLIPIGFRNSVAVRVALTAGGLASLMSIVFGPLISIFGGFFAVYLYGRRTGESLTMARGARLGWIAGLLVFVVASVVTTAEVSRPGFATAFHENMKNFPVQMSDEEMNRMIDGVRSPLGVPVILVTSFVLSTMLSAFGGAVGAKLLRRN